MRYPYEVRLAPGCYSGPDAPLVSRHRTLRAAVRQARKSNRWVVEAADSSRIIWRVRHYRDIGLGAGLYGQPESVMSLDECVADAHGTMHGWDE